MIREGGRRREGAEGGKQKGRVLIDDTGRYMTKSKGKVIMKTNLMTKERAGDTEGRT